jgi:hypothetical protein
MRKIPLILLTSALPLTVQVQAANTQFTYGGYIKFDAIASKYSEGEIAPANLGRDFYVPAAIPTGTTGNGGNAMDFGAKASRINFKSVTTLDNGETVTAFVEMDFLGSAQGNEVVSNSYSPRLRHAFFSHGHYTFGQTWTTFMNTGALPEVVDFLGVSEGTIFARQSQVRYTNGNIQLALENPETAVYNGATSPTDDSSMPDMVARYNLTSGNNSFAIAGIARQLAYKDEAADIDESITRFGINVSGVIKMGADDLKFSISRGDLGRYIGLGMVRDATLTNKGKLVGNSVTGGFIAYRHMWDSSFRSTLAYSMLTADNHEDAGMAVNKSAKSIRANLMWTPAPGMTYGVEASKATLEKESGVDGDAKTLQFTAKYAF